MIENLDEVAAMLRRRYPTARVQIVSFAKHPDLTMAEQVGAAWLCSSHSELRFAAAGCASCLFAGAGCALGACCLMAMTLGSPAARCTAP